MVRLSRLVINHYSNNSKVYLRHALTVYLLGLAIVVFVPKRQLVHQNTYASLSWEDGIGNLLLLVPLAVFLQILVPGWPRSRTFALVVCTSTLIELIQLVVPGRSGNLKDVLLNSAGGLIVIMMFSGRKRLPRHGSYITLDRFGEINP